jgi:hypothetical protein
VGAIRPSQLAPRRAPRRGVLLLVVLSMLVLFMLIGTAFLMSSSQYRTSSKAGAKQDRVGNYPTNLLDRGLMAVLRDTNNPNSAIRYHSLLRDMYGVDGFEGVVYSPLPTDSFNPNDPALQVSRYADAIVDVSATPVAEDLGPTQGQLIDIYVRALGHGLNDPLTTADDSLSAAILSSLPPDPRHVINLERNVNGIPQLHPLPLTKGYYNGCLLTIASGPARGQSTRIVNYEYIGDIAPIIGTNMTRLYRFRVMAFPRADGLPLQVDLLTTHNPELSDLAGATFIVNGRPFNGTGVGYNPLAAVGAPRLSALDIMSMTTGPGLTIPGEVALLPNSTYFFPTDLIPTDSIPQGIYYTPGPAGQLNPGDTSVVPIASRPTAWKYPTFAGPGDTDESYDAADFQNMALALQTVTPRSRGRVVQPDNTNVPNDADSLPDVLNVDDPNVNPNNFLRLDLEDLPLPSFHRPDLINYWFHRLMIDPVVMNAFPDDNERVRAVLQPYGFDGIRDGMPGDAGDNPGGDVRVRDLIVSVKRKISLRPLREDHPNFDGSNPPSRGNDLAGIIPLVAPTAAAAFELNIAIPYWEAVGPWDVDNDNDSVPDSNWVDLGDPVQQAEDGTLYKPLYAFLIVDMDSRLNVNAHGVAEHIGSPPLDVSFIDPNDPTLGIFGNLAHDLSKLPNAPGIVGTSDLLPQGLGYGPAEISLRPVFPAPWRDESGARYEGNRLEDSDFDGLLPPYDDALGNDAPVDDYATLLAGRIKAGSAIGTGREMRAGRYGFDPDWQNDYGPFRFDAAAGVTSVNTFTGAFGAPDVAAIFKFIGYPNSLNDYLGTPYARSSFATPPDLTGRYSLGLDYTGQPAYEFATEAIDRPLVADSPYELDLSSDRRRGMRADGMLMVYDRAAGPIGPSGPMGATNYFDEMGTPQYSIPSVVSQVPEADTDDAPFATAELERILRAHDPEAGAVPSRLWDLVAAFDPIKLLSFDPYRVQDAARTLFNDATLSVADANDEPQMLTAAQQMADINRRLVTTDSYDLPVPAVNMPGWVSEMGPDGRPGIRDFDDDPDGSGPATAAFGPDDSTEIGAPGSDDFLAVTGTPFNQATLVDLLLYRVFIEYIRKQGWDPVATPLLPAQIFEAKRQAEVIVRGEQFTDANNNGVWDVGETWGDTLALGGDNDGVYDPPLLPSLLAPELIAGQRMDLNRPFGDGRDNAGNGRDDNNNGLVDEFGEVGDPFDLANGIVDEPSEAGEPFLDLSGNGKWDDGTLAPVEPFIDVDGDGFYSPPRDYLWQNMTAESIAFDYTNGHGEPIHPSVAGGAIPAGAKVRNLNSQARQLYARQLYILMMLLVDENYVETPDVPSLGGTNVNNEWLLEAVAAANGRPGAPNDFDKEDTMRRLKAQQIAQWAINCVDFRDADAIMTPFEYDSNPWDGWGCPDADGVNIPLDGDVATNENEGEVIDWKEILPSGSNPNTKTISTTIVAKPANFQNQTRGVVWGTERPELLITETLAMHDRRCTEGPLTDPPNYDLDQRLKPRGSLFVELYNPWSHDGQKPAELYDRIADVDPTTSGDQPSEEGVMLNKLSDVGVDPDGAGPLLTKYSPVWRLMVFRDPISGVLTSQATGLLQTDPDGYLPTGMDIGGERWIYFTSGGDTDRSNDDDLFKDIQNVPGVGTVPTANNVNLSVWVPPVTSTKIPSEPFPQPASKRYFIARTDRRPPMALAPNDRDVEIAPILPGRYAVVGSSGLQYSGTGESGNSTPVADDANETTRFVTPISRLLSSSGSDQTDSEHKRNLGDTRRIELWPSIDPKVQQILVGENGGQEIVRMNGTYMNVTDGNLDGVPNVPIVAGTRVVEPCVAIPVEDMNISEPVEGYPSNYYKQRYADNGRSPALPSGPQQPRLTPTEGELVFNTPYDHPLDLELELVRNGTTQNYKSLHLQRLANPTLPWNPPPYLPDGKSPPTPNMRHQANLPVNPYLTIDSSSCDLTAYNGAGILERSDQPNAKADADMALKAYELTRDKTQGDFLAPLPAESLASAPDHYLWALIYTLKSKQINVTANTPKAFRLAIENQTATVRGWLDQLEAKQGGDVNLRSDVIEPRVDDDGRAWNSDWGWSLYTRKLPDDSHSKPSTEGTTGEFVQRLHMKSLERGGHPFGLDTTTFMWVLDPAWEPRVLWQQERPNFMLKNATIKISDLKNVRSRRALQTTTLAAAAPMDHFSTDDGPRATYLNANLTFREHVMDYVLEQTLGFANEAYGQEIDRTDGDAVAIMSTQKPGAPEIVDKTDVDAIVMLPEQAEIDQWNSQEAARSDHTPAIEQDRRKRLVQSTYPWLTWNDRPFVSQDEIMQVPGANSSLMLRRYSTINSQTPTPYNGTLADDFSSAATTLRIATQQSPFGHLLNFFMTAVEPARVKDASGALELFGAPNNYRILDYVEVPSRYVGTETLLRPEVFNDVPGVDDSVNTVGIALGSDITGPADPRYALQPPYNKVSRQRDPGRVNLNTVVGRREVVGGNPRSWSEVYDGLMHRVRDGNLFNTTGSTLLQLSQFGPAWRDVTLSRRGYEQYNADAAPTSVDKPAPGAPPDTLTFGLNKYFPSFFSNPFRSPEAGFLVPLDRMLQHGVDASWLRVHPRFRGNAIDDDGDGVVDNEPDARVWGNIGDDDGNGLVDDIREAGFGDDGVSKDFGNAQGKIPEYEFLDPDRDMIPLFSEVTTEPSIDAQRNPYMMYEPMSRLGNLVTTRSNVYAIWITVGYFEVEPAPDWNHPDLPTRLEVRAKFGGNNTDTAPATIAARALYDRVYPEGYALAQELGSATGDVRRERAFYIIDRTRPVGFKPGEDLNVEDAILVRRRIE